MPIMWGPLARAGKVKRQTPKPGIAYDRKKPKQGRAKKRKQYNLIKNTQNEKSIFKSLQEHHISKKGPSSYSMYTKLADGVDFIHDVKESKKIPTYEWIHQKLPMGQYSYEREREIREHITERILYEIKGSNVLTDRGQPMYRIPKSDDGNWRFRRHVKRFSHLNHDTIALESYNHPCSPSFYRREQLQQMYIKFNDTIVNM